LVEVEIEVEIEGNLQECAAPCRVDRGKPVELRSQIEDYPGIYAKLLIEFYNHSYVSQLLWPFTLERFNYICFSDLIYCKSTYSTDYKQIQ